MTGSIGGRREAFRLFVRSPGFAAAVVLPLALALGASTALFSVIRGVLLRPLPYAQPERLVRLYRMSPGVTDRGGPLSPLNYVEDLAATSTLERKAVWAVDEASLAGEGPAEHIRAGFGTASLLPLLGLQPALGRWFSEEEERQGQNHRIVLSHALWLRRFGGDPAALGRSLEVDGEPYVVVGVLPTGLELPELCDAWIPLSFEPRHLEPAARNRHFLRAMARLAPGSTLESARRELAEISVRTIEAHPEAYHSFRFAFTPVLFQEDTVRSVRSSLLLLFVAVSLVLLIACFNVGNLMLARATARQRELAIRSALGAGRAALVRQLLAESLVLSLAAGALGIVLALATTSALLSLAPAAVPRAQAVRLDWVVLAFSGLTALGTGVLFGLVPALSASDVDLDATLRGSGSMRPRARRLRRALVAVDIGLALVLLCAASLLLRSFVEALGVDPGFRGDDVATFQAVVPTPSGTSQEELAARSRRYVEEAVRALRGIPGVESAGAVSRLPVSHQRSDRLFSVEGRVQPPGDEPLDEEYRAVTPGFFESLRIPVLQGRTFEEPDGDNGLRVVVVNQSFARKIFPRGDALGQRISLTSPASDWATVVGVVGDVRELGLDEPVLPIMYFAHAQQPQEGMNFVVRSALPFVQVSRSLAIVVTAVDPGVPAFGIRPLESLLAASVAARRFSLVLVATFAFLALLLAAVGLYGVVAYSVRQRTKEIGVRMAIGADAGRIARLVLNESAQMVGAGLAAGLVAALAGGRVLAGFLYGVGPGDPLALAASAATLALAAVLATALPIRRATRVDPVIALGSE